MWQKISDILGVGNGARDKVRSLELATAALLVQVSYADQDFSDQERLVLLETIQTHFDLTGEEALKLLDDAEQEQTDASCLFRFTRIITSELDQDGRQDIVRLLWRVAFADQHIDNFEANALAKISNLLGVTSEDRIRIKHEVMAEG